MSFICMRMKNIFHIKGWALNLVLIQRPGGTLGSGLLTIGFCVKNELTLELLVPKIWTGGLFYLREFFFFWKSKTISQLNFERLLVTDFCSNDFSEISLARLLYQQRRTILEIYNSLETLVYQACVRVWCIFQTLTYMYLVFPEIVLASTREGEPTGNPSSSFFGPILFLGNIQKKKRNE